MSKEKPQRRDPAGSSSRIISMERSNWIDIEPGKHSLSAYEVSKKVIHLLRHSQQAKAFLSPWTGCDTEEEEVSATGRGFEGRAESEWF